MKTVVITGASSGFGKGAQALLTERGDRVVAASRSSSPALDLTAPSSIEGFAKQLHTQFPDGIDALVNNAGIGVYGPFDQIPMPEWRKQFEVNFFGALDLTQRLLPLLAKKRGVLVQVSSVLGFYGLGYSSAYVASKFALTGWTESVRTELSNQGVRVALIEPGSFQTGFSTAVQWYGLDQSPVQAYRHQHETKSRNSHANEVPLAILKAIDSSRSFLRIRCGREPTLLRLAQRVLPECMYYALLDRMERRLFKI